MNQENNSSSFRVPSRNSLIASTLIAAVAAGVILVTIILPAEYGIDPTGMGKALGLTALSGSERRESPPSGAAAKPWDAAPNTGVNGDIAGNHRQAYRTDVVEIRMAPGEELEYKAALAQGEPLLYSWETGNREHLVYYDFHGEPADADAHRPPGYFMRYEEQQDGAASSHGYLVAPFIGKHGWYLLNFNDYPVTVRLTISGNYSWHGFLGRWNNNAETGEVE